MSVKCFRKVKLFKIMRYNLLCRLETKIQYEKFVFCEIVILHLMKNSRLRNVEILKLKIKRLGVEQKIHRRKR